MKRFSYLKIMCSGPAFSKVFSRRRRQPIVLVHSSRDAETIKRNPDGYDSAIKRSPTKLVTVGTRPLKETQQSWLRPPVSKRSPFLATVARAEAFATSRMWFKTCSLVCDHEFSSNYVWSSDSTADIEMGMIKQIPGVKDQN